MKKTTQFIMLSATVGLALAQSASAAIIYSNNFDSEALGQVNGTPFIKTGGTGSYADIVAGNANFASQHLEIGSRSDTFNYSFPNFDGSTITDPGWASVTTFKFDFRLNSATFTGAAQLRLRGRDTTWAGSGTDDTTRFDINAGAVTADTVHTIEYVINNSTSAATAPSVGGTIAAGSYAVYIDGNATPVAGGSNFTAADNSAVDKLTLWIRGDAGSSTQGIAQIDNFEVHAIPEPATLGLVAAFGGTLLSIRRLFMM